MIKVELKIVFSSANLYFPPPLRNYETSFGTKGHLKIPTVTTATYGKKAVISSATKIWNNIQRQVKDPIINTIFPNSLWFFLSIYVFIKPFFISSCGIYVWKTVKLCLFFMFYFYSY